MKKLKISFIAVLFLLLLTGCVEQETEMTIASDGKTTVVQTILTSKELTKQAEEKGESISDWLMQQFASDSKENLTIEPITIDGRSGVELSHTFDSIEDAFNSSFYVSDDVIEGKVPSPWIIEERENLLSKHVSIKGTVDYNEWLAGKNNLDQKEKDIVESVGDNFILKYSITTPVKTVVNNADEVNKRIHTWTVEKGETKDFKLYYHYLKMDNLLIILGSSAVVIAAIWLFRLYKKKKK